MLKHGLQEMHHVTLSTPERRRDQPDRERLAERFQRFLDAS
jgi:putative restriction endonuclease